MKRTCVLAFVLYALVVYAPNTLLGPDSSDVRPCCLQLKLYKCHTCEAFGSVFLVPKALVVPIMFHKEHVRNVSEADMLAVEASVVAAS